MLIERGHLDYTVDREFDGARMTQACQCGCGRDIDVGERIVNVTVHQKPALSFIETCWIHHACAHDLQMFYLSNHATARRLARNILPEP